MIGRWQGAAPAGAVAWIGEARATLALTGPLVLTQLGQIAIMTTDVMMVGRLGADDLAAASLGHVVFFVAFCGAMGIVMATAPLAAQAYGAHRPRTLRRVIRQGLWVALLMTVPFCFAAAPFVERFMIAIGQPAAVASGAHVYLSAMLWSLPTAIAFIVLRNFAAAVNRPEPALWVMLAGVPLNALLDYVLIFGAFGAPRLEIFGAGVASAIINLAMFAAMLAIVLRRAPFRRYRLLGRFWRPDWAIVRHIFAIGLPIAGAVLMEYGIFALAAVQMGWFSTTAIAAHQIALQIGSITFMVPLGIGQAATVRVGQAVGRGDADGIRRAGWTAAALGIAFMALMSMVIVAMPGPLARLFLDAGTEGGMRVAELAAVLLLFVAAFQVADGAQTIGLHALRGLNDTTVPMLIVAFGYWVVGLATCYGLGFVAGLGPVGIWIGLSVGLGLVACLVLGRFALMTRPHVLPRLVTGAA